MQNTKIRKVKPMKLKVHTLLLGTLSMMSSYLFAQSDSANCFLYDYEPDTAVIPAYVEAEEPTGQVSAIVTLTGDTIGKISNYVFGNAIAAWAGAHDNSTLIEGVELLAPTLIRFPGGSWSNGYFYNGVPSDVPDSIYDGTTYNASTHAANKIKFYGHDGTEGWVTSTDQWYALRENTNVNEGLITVNYGYARYGTSIDPVAKAAHLAADWVRYDNGRTKFWEIGNENGGPWEYGWIIDTALNQDGQPQIITGELYGRHFKVFADSMRKAAAEIGDTIFIGGQIVVNGETSWNFVDQTWNSGFFQEVGDYADFYVIHNYFDNSTVNNILNSAHTNVKQNMDFIQQDFINKGANPKPVALTEYNMWGGNDEASVSYINGMQAVILICEMIDNKFGLGSRWLLISGATTIFYGGSDANYLNHPHAEFYYLTYLQKLYGDLAISTTSSHTDILSYASTYSSGETSLIIVNKGINEKIVTVSTDSIGVGEKYYMYSFTGGADDGDFSPNVFINGEGPDTYQWGPYNELFDIQAKKYTVEGDITFTSPGRSVQMILIDKGDNHIHVDDSILVPVNTSETSPFHLNQNFPNPVNSTTLINYKLPENDFVSLKILDLEGREIIFLVNEYQNAGNYSVQLNTSDLQSGVYFYGIQAGQNRDIKKLVVIK
jgi:hypothetical protein